MKTEEAIGIIRNHGHKYTNKRREMIDIFVEEDGVSTPDMVRQKINDWYEHCDAGVFVGFDIKKDYDIMFATGWQTVDFVRKLPAKKKAYFIQDY